MFLDPSQPYSWQLKIPLRPCTPRIEKEGERERRYSRVESKHESESNKGYIQFSYVMHKIEERYEE